MAKIRNKSQLEDSIREYLGIMKVIHEMEKKADAIKANIQDYMGAREVIITEHYTINYPCIVSHKMDVKRFQEDFPILYNQYLSNHAYRRFTIKE